MYDANFTVIMGALSDQKRKSVLACGKSRVPAVGVARPLNAGMGNRSPEIGRINRATVAYQSVWVVSGDGLAIIGDPDCKK